MTHRYQYPKDAKNGFYTPFVFIDDRENGGCRFGCSRYIGATNNIAAATLMKFLKL